MFPANEFVIAAEDAYRRERMIAVRPPRRSRRTRKTRQPKPFRRHGFQQLLSSRAGAGRSADRQATPAVGRSASPSVDQGMSQGMSQDMSQDMSRSLGQGADHVRAA